MTDYIGAAGYGSLVDGVIPGSTTDKTIVPAGVKCVFDGILFNGGGDQDSAVLRTTIQTASGVTLALIDANAKSQGNRLGGSVHAKDSVPGRVGVVSNDGLRVLKEAGTLGSRISVLYRIGMP